MADDQIRCAKCTFVALDIFPKMMQDLLEDTQESPQSVLRKIMRNNNFIMPLNSFEMNALQTMPTDRFMKLDVSLMYKIIKFFRLIDHPTRNWGANPFEQETKLGDDIERIRRARNHLVHKVDAKISKQSYIEFFDNITKVSRRLDKYLKKPEGNGYENMVQEYKSCILDTEEKNKWLDKRQKEECLKRTY